MGANPIPDSLIEQINKGNVVLFLGSGASVGAKHPNKETPPIGQKLADLIAKKFLPETYIGKTLKYVSEIAISERDIFTVQKHVAEIFEKFEPGDHHKLIPKFFWKSIITTNYDLIVERAYNLPNSLQELVVFKKNGERIEDKMASRNSVIYNKLHGCITDINDLQTPLILTPDQYVSHRKNRDRLFDRVKELTYENTFLFVGFSFEDHDIREALDHLNFLGDARPRSYMVGPYISNEEIRLWEGKKITSVVRTFEDFMLELDGRISSEFRMLTGIVKDDHHAPIYKKFVVSPSEVKPSESLVNFLELDVEYIHVNIAQKDSDPKQFYKGYFDSWDPIIKNLDVKRDIQDGILSEIFLAEENERSSLQDFYVIKGQAGSGKTVLLKRLAWEASTEFDKLCLFLKPEIPIRYEPISELYNFCKERIFLFIDNPSEYLDDIVYILKKSKRDKIPLTIISAERINVWNSDCDELDVYLNQDYKLQYLNNNEIKDLIFLLSKHKSLGYLESKSNEERIDALSEKAGRELLVALHEATMGKPFADIILDEYNKIKGDEAKSLYLTICIIHRLGTYTRAGLISRVHEIGMSYFKEYLFKPLEFIVFDKFNQKINDYVLTTRHQHIAEIVFEQVLINTQRRYDEYIRIISNLDVDYESDHHAFIYMTNSKKLQQIFKDSELIRSIYALASKKAPENLQLQQQEAIFEMTSERGNFEKAGTILNAANQKDPKNSQIAHSLAEFYFKKSEKTSQKILKDKYLKESKEMCENLVKNNNQNLHALHTLLKINLIELRNVLEEGKTPLIEIKIKEFEKILTTALQTFPKEGFLLDAESNFNELLKDEPRALDSLKKAFEINKRSTYICLRLANFYEKQNQEQEAIRILNEALEVNSNDKDINYRYAKLLGKVDNPNYNDIKHYLRKSFTKGDTRYDAQFLYARCLYILGERSDAIEIFDELKNVSVDPKIKKEPRGIYSENKKTIQYKGTITKLEASYGFIKRDGISDSIFLLKFHNIKNWDDFKRNSRISFNLAFNYQGAIAINVQVGNF